MMTRMPSTRLAAAVATTTLLTAGLTACGGPPRDASVPDFCSAVTDRSWVDGLDPDSSGDEIVDALGKWADELEETGTPDGIPDDAREGFEITIDTLHDLDPDDFDSPDDLRGVTGDLSEDDQAKVDALTDYRSEKCGSG